MAVATNFAPTAEVISARFSELTGHQVRFTVGSTGKLYAQILHGAPFEGLLAADQARPARLEQTGQAVAGSRFTYAHGRLVLWSTDTALISTDGPAALERPFRHLAIANPDLAPYGLAAIQTIQQLGLTAHLAPLLVKGENVGQAYGMVATGNAEMGLVAASSDTSIGSRWAVPENLHEPIRQDAVLLKRGRDHPAPLAFLEYLASPGAVAIIRAAGYGTD